MIFKFNLINYLNYLNLRIILEITYTHLHRQMAPEPIKKESMKGPKIDGHKKEEVIDFHVRRDGQRYTWSVQEE